MRKVREAEKVKEVREENLRFGHKRLIVWNNVEEINEAIYNRLLSMIPKTQFKLRDQIDRATSSIGANLVEGYYSGSTKEFIKFLNYSRRSLAELDFWIDHCKIKGYITTSLCSSIKDLVIRTCYLTDRLIISLKRKIN